jgi:rhodanese-related sulfurtransferase
MLEDEIVSNPFLQRADEDDFVDFVSEYFPPIADAGVEGQVVLQCGTQRVKTAAERYTDVTPDQLTQMLKTDSELLLLDVREESELRAFGAIPGVMNISSKSLSSQLDLLPKGRNIVVVCQSGGRSSEAAHLLSTKGFHHVYNLLGGTGGWIARGLPVERPQFASTSNNRV